MVAGDARQRIRQPRAIAVGAHMVRAGIAHIDDVTPFVGTYRVIADTRRQQHAADGSARNAAELLTQTEHLLLGKDQRFVNRVKIARRQFGQTREPFRNIGTGLLAALAATHAVAHHIHAVACAGAVLVVFPTQADIAVQTDLNMFDVHESRPFTPIFRKRIFRKWNMSASDSFARHLRNVGSEPSMNFRSSAMSCQ